MAFSAVRAATSRVARDVQRWAAADSPVVAEGEDVRAVTSGL